MGFFRTKKKTIISVSSTAVPLIEMQKDPISQAVMEAVRDDWDIVDYIFDDQLVHGLGFKIRKTFNYARDHYELGLPQTTLKSMTLDPVAVQTAIQDIEGAPVQVVESDLEAGNEWFFVAYWLYQNRSFNFLTNEIEPQPGWKAGLDNAKNNDRDWVDTKVAEIEADLALEFPDYSTSESTTTQECVDVCVNPQIDPNYVEGKYYEARGIQSARSHDPLFWQDVADAIAAQMSPATYGVAQGQIISNTYGYQILINFYYTSDDSLRTQIWEPIYEMDCGTSSEFWCNPSTEDLTICPDGVYEEQCTDVVTTTNIDTTYSFDSVIDEQHEDSNTLLDTTSTFVDGFITGFDVDYQLGSVSLYTVTTDVWKHTDGEADELVETRTNTFVRYPSSVYSESVSLSPNMHDDHLLAAYIVNNEPKLFLANIESGTYSYLGAQLIDADAGEFYPIVPLRLDNVDLTIASKQSTNLFITSERLLDKLDLNIFDLADAINENPDVGEVDHAFLLMGTNIMTDNRAGLRYLNEFFYALDQLGGNEVTIEDSKFKFKVQWSSITTEVKAGSLGYRGKSDRLIGSNYIQWRQQISENTLRVVTVYDPVHTNYIYQGHNVVTDLAKAQEEDDNNFYVPLYQPSVKKLPPLERNRLYFASLQLVFNSYKVTIQKIKWYQKSIFRTILTIIAIVIVIYTGYYGIMNLANMTLQAAVMAVIKAIVIAAALRVVFRLVVKAFGVEAALILAVVAMAFGMYDLANNAWQMSEAMWAEYLLQVSTGLTTAINDTISNEIMNTRREFTTLQSDFRDWAADAKAQMDELAALNEELFGFNSWLDPMRSVALVPATNSNETPDDYYNRTVHTGNPGVMCYGMLENFVPIALKLPNPPPLKADGEQGIMNKESSDG